MSLADAYCSCRKNFITDPKVIQEMLDIVENDNDTNPKPCDGFYYHLKNHFERKNDKKNFAKYCILALRAQDWRQWNVAIPADMSLIKAFILLNTCGNYKCFDPDCTKKPDLYSVEFDANSILYDDVCIEQAWDSPRFSKYKKISRTPTITQQLAFEIFMKKNLNSKNIDLFRKILTTYVSEEKASDMIKNALIEQFFAGEDIWKVFDSNVPRAFFDPKLKL